MNNNINISRGNTILYMYNDIEIDVHDIFINSSKEDRELRMGEHIRQMYDLNHVTIINTINNRKCIMITETYEIIEMEYTHKIDVLTGRHHIILKKDSLITLDKKFPFIHNRCEEDNIGVVILYAKDMRILKANDTFLKFLEGPYSKEKNSIGKTFYEVVPNWSDSESEKIWTYPYREGKSNYRKEVKFKGFDRGTTYWDIMIEPYIENGEVIYIIGTAREMTEIVTYRKRIEKQSKIILKQNELLEESLRQKDEFVSIISHELKTPISIIYAIIQLFEGVYDNIIPKKIKKHIKVIKQNTLRQLRLVNNLLDIARIKAENMKLNYSYIDIVCYTEAIVESVIGQAKLKNISLIFDTSVEEKIIPIDHEKYEKIVLNLLSNAIKFTPKDGKIKVNIDMEDGYILLEVKDSGIGIPKDKQELIFENFGQVDTSLSRENEGTGLGLSIVKSLIDAMKGKISVESIGGEGTSFHVYLPISREDIKINNREHDGSLQSELVEKINIEFSDIYY